MIRGVSRQIIEVQETGSAYYEKAYLIVNPEFSGAERQLLEREARKVIKSMGAPSGMKKARRVWHWVWRLGASAAIGAGLMALCIYLF
jgi:hypothetical protein